MTYSRPGQGTHVTPSGHTLVHGQAALESNFVGVVVKQKAAHWSDGFVTPAVIADGEKCWMITSGIVQVPTVSGFAKGDAIYITSSNVLTKTSTSNTKFGRVVEVVGDGRTVPTGKIRIDLDDKDSF